MSKKFVIVGAGLCGTLLALRLAQRGYEVDVFERRPDMRKADISAGRSINLALSDRGLLALERVGLKNDILPLTIPMLGREIHTISGETHSMPYSGRENEWINSISRGGLNKLLLDKAEETGRIRLHFETECIQADFDRSTIQIQHLRSKTPSFMDAEVVFGTDGSASAIRQAMLQASARLRFDFSITYLTTGYKELEIPAGPDNAFQLKKNALHIWPRKGFMMIALPNLDGSFTVTLFLPMEGDISFKALREDQDIHNFMQEYFPDMIPMMPDFMEDFTSNPTSSLGTVKCFPWQVGGKFLLLGDAAHAVVPFYGQGMNASFEDVGALDRLIDVYDGDWQMILPAFERERKPNADAIADLAVENESEMRAATADPVFQLKRRIELHLEQNYPDYFSKYSMVTFREDLSYHEAMVKGRKQDDFLMQVARQAGQFEKVNIEDVIQTIQTLM
jgi:kynurenine 3-monooxygenase